MSKKLQNLLIILFSFYFLGYGLVNEEFFIFYIFIFYVFLFFIFLKEELKKQLQELLDQTFVTIASLISLLFYHRYFYIS